VKVKEERRKSMIMLEGKTIHLGARERDRKK